MTNRYPSTQKITQRSLCLRRKIAQRKSTVCTNLRRLSMLIFFIRGTVISVGNSITKPSWNYKTFCKTTFFREYPPLFSCSEKQPRILFWNPKYLEPEALQHDSHPAQNTNEGIIRTQHTTPVLSSVVRPTFPPLFG